MKDFPVAILFIITCAAFINPEQQKDPLFDKLYALEGRWTMKTNKGFIGEEWTRINKNFLQNRGFMIRDNDTVITERVELRNTMEGIFYTSTVEDQNNKKPIAFRLTSADNNIFLFENPQHDFPKKISYRFINQDSLHAWIDDGKDIPEKKLIFRYSRQK